LVYGAVGGSRLGSRNRRGALASHRSPQLIAMVRVRHAKSIKRRAGWAPTADLVDPVPPAKPMRFVARLTRHKKPRDGWSPLCRLAAAGRARARLGPGPLRARRNGFFSWLTHPRNSFGRPKCQAKGAGKAPFFPQIRNLRKHLFTNKWAIRRPHNPRVIKVKYLCLLVFTCF